MIVAETIYWLCGFAVVFTYVIYPAILKVLSIEKRQNENCYTTANELPRVSIVVSAYNEELVIEEKIKSIFTTDYPTDKIELLIGSDSSSDNTTSIIKKLQGQYPAIKLSEFKERRGKPAVLNDLMKEVKGSITILTDANVMFTPATIFQLVKHFNNTAIGLVGGNIYNKGVSQLDISVVEENYIQRENHFKYQEGIVFGTMMGPFGGCYAIQTSLYTPIPQNFLVDDFFICLKIIDKGYKAILEKEAICYEDVSSDIMVEFRRKARISAGNYQNLGVFANFFLNPFSAKGFCFWSHKVLRWFTPFFILTAYLLSAFLAYKGNIYYKYLLVLETILLASPLWDEIIKRMGTHIKSLRFMAYFCWMNLALMAGFFNYLKGIKNNVWEPTKRNK